MGMLFLAAASSRAFSLGVSSCCRRGLVVLVVAALIVIVVAVGMLVAELRTARRLPFARWQSDGELVVPRPLAPESFHAFVSHQWSSGQDQARSVKSAMQLLVPHLRVWLDVDDMRSKAGTTATSAASFGAVIESAAVLVAQEWEWQFLSEECQAVLPVDASAAPPCAAAQFAAQFFRRAIRRAILDAPPTLPGTSTSRCTARSGRRRRSATRSAA